MSAQPKFKIKRPHSPDHVGICNYKKQRLLFDLESLSLRDDKNPQLEQRWRNHQRHVQKNDLSSETVDEMYVPYATANHPLKVLQSDQASLWDSNLVYARLSKSVKEAQLQVVKWTDMRQLCHAQWLQWLQNYLSRQDFDYDMDNEANDPRIVLDNDIDEDIDMDA